MPKERLIVFQRGHKVGDMAQDLFPGGINMSPGHPAAFKQAIINTEEKIKECSRLRIVSVASLLAESIRRIHGDESVSSLFV